MGFFDTISNAFSSAKNWVVGAANSVGNFVNNNIVAPIKSVYAGFI